MTSFPLNLILEIKDHISSFPVSHPVHLFSPILLILLCIHTKPSIKQTCPFAVSFLFLSASIVTCFSLNTQSQILRCQFIFSVLCVFPLIRFNSPGNHVSNPSTDLITGNSSFVRFTATPPTDPQDTDLYPFLSFFRRMCLFCYSNCYFHTIAISFFNRIMNLILISF